MFIGFLDAIVHASNHTKCISLNNQHCVTQSIFVYLHPNVCSQKLCYYPLPVKLHRCVGSCNTLNDLSNIVYVPNETEDLNLSVFNIITVINESIVLIKHIWCKCECKLHGRKWQSIQNWNNDKC